MSATPEKRMTADEFIAWAESRPERYELIDGRVLPQAAERAAHVRTKVKVHNGARVGDPASRRPCHARAVGMAVRIDKGTVFEPDVHVYCGPELPGDALISEDPIIVVEVKRRSRRTPPDKA